MAHRGGRPTEEVVSQTHEEEGYLNQISSYLPNVNDITQYVRGSGPSQIASIGSEHSEEKEPVIHVSFGTGQPIERPETGPKHTKCESIYLLLGYTTGFQVWDVTHLDSIFEVSSKRTPPVKMLKILADPCEERTGKIGKAARGLREGEDADHFHSVLRMGPRLAIVSGVRSEEQSGAFVKIYSLASQTYVHTLKLSERIEEIASNASVLAVCLESKVVLYDSTKPSFPNLYNLPCFPNRPYSPVIAVGSTTIALSAFSSSPFPADYSESLADDASAELSPHQDSGTARMDALKARPNNLLMASDRKNASYLNEPDFEYAEDSRTRIVGSLGRQSHPFGERASEGALGSRSNNGSGCFVSSGAPQSSSSDPMNSLSDEQYPSVNEMAQGVASGLYYLGRLGKKTISPYLHSSSQFQGGRGETIGSGVPALALPDAAFSDEHKSTAEARLGPRSHLNSSAAQSSTSLDAKLSGSSRNAGAVAVYEGATGRLLSYFVAHQQTRISAMSFDKSGTLLATAPEEGQNIHVFKVVGGTQRLLYKLVRGITRTTIRSISFTNDSRWLAATSSRGTSHLFALNPDGGPVTAETHAPLLIRRVHGAHSLRESESLVAAESDAVADTCRFATAGPTTTSLHAFFGDRERQRTLRMPVLQRLRQPTIPSKADSFRFCDSADDLVTYQPVKGSSGKGADNNAAWKANSSPREILPVPVASTFHRQHLLVCSAPGTLSAYAFGASAKPVGDGVAGATLDSSSGSLASFVHTRNDGHRVQGRSDMTGSGKADAGMDRLVSSSMGPASESSQSRGDLNTSNLSINSSQAKPNSSSGFASGTRPKQLGGSKEKSTTGPSLQLVLERTVQRRFDVCRRASWAEVQNPVIASGAIGVESSDTTKTSQHRVAKMNWTDASAGVGDIAHSEDITNSRGRRKSPRRQWRDRIISRFWAQAPSQTDLPSVERSSKVLQGQLHKSKDRWKSSSVTTSSHTHSSWAVAAQMEAERWVRQAEIRTHTPPLTRLWAHTKIGFREMGPTMRDSVEDADLASQERSAKAESEGGSSVDDLSLGYKVLMEHQHPSYGGKVRLVLDEIPSRAIIITRAGPRPVMSPVKLDAEISSETEAAKTCASCPTAVPTDGPKENSSRNANGRSKREDMEDAPATFLDFSAQLSAALTTSMDFDSRYYDGEQEDILGYSENGSSLLLASLQDEYFKAPAQGIDGPSDQVLKNVSGEYTLSSGSLSVSGRNKGKGRMPMELKIKDQDVQLEDQSSSDGSPGKNDMSEKMSGNEAQRTSGNSTSHMLANDCAVVVADLD